MELSQAQADALTELLHIGYGRSAAALAELTGHRVTLGSPQVAVRPVPTAIAGLNQAIAGTAAGLNQPFSGPIIGNAILLLDEAGAVTLSRLILGEAAAPSGHIDQAVREVVTEVGNILLNACLGVMGNTLELNVNFGVPFLDVASVNRLVQQATIEAGASSYAMTVETRFQLQAAKVDGCMAIFLDLASLRRLIEEVDRWQGPA